MKRRKFFKNLGIASAAVFVAPKLLEAKEAVKEDFCGPAKQAVLVYEQEYLKEGDIFFDSENMTIEIVSKQEEINKTYPKNKSTLKQVHDMEMQRRKLNLK